MLHSTPLPRHGLLQPGEGLQGGGSQREDLGVLAVRCLDDVATEPAALLHPATDPHLVLLASNLALEAGHALPQLLQLGLKCFVLLVNSGVDLCVSDFRHWVGVLRGVGA